MKKKVLNITIIIIIILFIAYLFWGVNDREKHLSGKIQYKVGEIIEYDRGANVSPWFTYKFYINDKVYKGQHGIDDSLISLNNSELRKFIGNRYLVKYSIEKPIYNELLFNKPIVDSLKDCIECSWRNLPF